MAELHSLMPWLIPRVVCLYDTQENHAKSTLFVFDGLTLTAEVEIPDFAFGEDWHQNRNECIFIAIIQCKS
jgi:hypothetical protein